MLDRKFDPDKPYATVIFTRLSTNQQNKRSLRQQITEIKRAANRLKLKLRF